MSNSNRKRSFKGTVKWFNDAKNYGFIENSDGTGDVFVHVSQLNKAGLKTLNEGEIVEFNTEVSKKTNRPAACDLRLIENRA